VKILLALVLTFYLALAQAQTYLQVNGASLHDQPGYNSWNWGAGLEQGITDRWTVAGGWYRNSDYRGSTYAYGRYAFYKKNAWDIGIAVRSLVMNHIRWLQLYFQKYVTVIFVRLHYHVSKLLVPMLLALGSEYPLIRITNIPATNTVQADCFGPFFNFSHATGQHKRCGPHVHKGPHVAINHPVNIIIYWLQHMFHSRCWVHLA
jgi:hypothetical protein